MINKLSTFNIADQNLHKINIWNDMKPIFNSKNISSAVKVSTNKYSGYINELRLILKENYTDEISSADIVVLSEPYDEEIKEEELSKCIEDYRSVVKEAKKNNIDVVHLVKNNKWFQLFTDIINNNNIKVFGHEHHNIKMVNQVKITKPFLNPTDFIHYSNEINNNILIDLTSGYKIDGHYKLNLKKLIYSAEKVFNNITLMINDNSFIPRINSDKVKVVKESKLTKQEFENHTYVYLYTNSPYQFDSINKYIFYAANSKVVFSNYNYYMNNMLPSVILNMNNVDYDFYSFSEFEAFNIINENRNTILYKHTLVNILDEICNDVLGTSVIVTHNVSDHLECFDYNLFINNTNSDTNSIYLKLNNYKYDLEYTLLFPILFLGKESVSYRESKCYLRNGKTNNNISIPKFKSDVLPQSNKKFSMIVPIHNNGRYLKYKCFNSILKLTCLKDIEIIFIDDGSSDNETIRIINDLLISYPAIIFKRFESGSGSASRPRNEGVLLSSTDYITFLDPDNEAIEDGYTYLIEEIENDDDLDMVVGNIIREDNIKRNEISYSKKLNKVQKSNYITDTKTTLVNLNLSVQSIQALMVRKSIIIDNNIKMVEGAAGQDTLYFQELMINCEKVKVIKHNIHSYYAFVEGSVTNTVTSKFFEKFYKVEIERIKFLEENNLIEYYMKNRFNLYVINWYLKKIKQVRSEDKIDSLEYIRKIITLYSTYEMYFDEKIKEIIR